MDSETVLGHYVADASGQWVPALQQSTELFKAVVNDDISKFERELDALRSGSLGAFTILYWSEGRSGEQATPQVQAKARNLLALAVYHGSLRVLSHLLSKGANPKAGQDGQSAYEFIQDSNPNAATIRAMLDDAAGNFAVMGGDPASSVPRAGGHDEQSSSVQTQQMSLLQEVEQSQFDNLPYSTADLTRPEYSTDTFRMYCFKVLRCSKRYAHDWRACPFGHPTENARRRDPREFRYSSLVCPDYRQGCCVRGDTCQYAHGVFESWLHPSRYRTQLCKDQEKCDRPVCFFAHSIQELRTPVNSFVPNPEERLRVPEAMQVVLGLASPAALSTAGTTLSSGGADTAYIADQNPTSVQDNLLKPSQQLSSSSSTLAGSGSSGGGALSIAAGGSSSGSAAAGPEAGSHGIDQGSSSSSTAAAAAVRVSSSPTKQLVSPSAVPVPRMSNAFARKHGLDPRENPLVNLQRLAFQQQIPSPQQTAAAAATGRRTRRARGPHQSPSPQPLLQQLPLQPPPAQFMQQAPLSPAAAAAYYGAPGPLGPLQPGPQAPHSLIPDPQAVALLFGGMNLTGPLSPAAAAAMPQMHPQMAQQIGFHHMGGPAPHVAIPQAMLGGGGLTPQGLGPPSPLGQPGIAHGGLPSPQPQPF